MEPQEPVDEQARARLRAVLTSAAERWARRISRSGAIDEKEIGLIAEALDAQAYHASVLQTHPLGHILVPFRTSPVEDWSLGFNVFDPVLINAGPGIEVVPAITLALIREETLPVVRFVGGPSAEVPASEELSIEFRLETPQGVPITDRDAEVYLEATAGYL